MVYTDDKQPSGLDAKATPVDADVVVVGDSADSNRVKKTTFAELRTWIEAITSYFNVTSDTSDAITEGSTNLLMTTAERSKLSGIEALADVTDATNVNAAGATMNTDTDVSGNSWVLDEDTLVSDDNTKVPTQQSVKAYVDSKTGFDTQTAGETINGATTPVAVYMDNSDDEWYACDANDTTKLNFQGFATTNGTDGATFLVQMQGIVSGFTGLTKGARYYVQDDKTIGTTVGTYEVKVGTAVSTTELLIEKNQTKAYISIESGSQAINGAATHDIAINCGFRPTLVEVVGQIRADVDVSTGDVHNLEVGTGEVLAPSYWVNGTYQGWRYNDSGNNISDITDGLLDFNRDVVGGSFKITVTSVTETGFNLTITNRDDTDTVYWNFQLKVIG